MVPQEVFEMAVSQREILVRLRPRPYRRLEEWAQRVGKTPESLTQEIVEQALRESACLDGPTRTTREILQSTGRVRVVGEALRRRIIPGVTLDEVRASLARAGGPSLSETVLAQRDSRS